MDFTPGTLVAVNLVPLKVKFSFGSPDYNSPVKEQITHRTKVLTEPDVYLSYALVPPDPSVLRASRVVGASVVLARDVDRQSRPASYSQPETRAILSA
jgi:hypothetical protein